MCPRRTYVFEELQKLYPNKKTSLFLLIYEKHRWRTKELRKKSKRWNRANIQMQSDTAEWKLWILTPVETDRRWFVQFVRLADERAKDIVICEKNKKKIVLVSGRV